MTSQDTEELLSEHEERVTELTQSKETVENRISRLETQKATRSDKNVDEIDQLSNDLSRINLELKSMKKEVATTRKMLLSEKTEIHKCEQACTDNAQKHYKADEEAYQKYRSAVVKFINKCIKQVALKSSTVADTMNIMRGEVNPY